MSYEDFDTEQAPEFSMKYDTQSTLLSDVTGGVVASVADFGSSVWNSLPFTEEVTTEDLLGKIDSNALRVYEENPDTIHAASFVGGVFVPTGLALKGMNFLRNGVKGANWFSEAGKVERASELSKLYAAGSETTPLFREAARNMYIGTAANAVVDSAAMEASLVLTMNAHPFMEDYMKDPIKNFVSSTAIGAGIIGTVGHIFDRSVVRGAMASVETDAWKSLTDVATAPDKTQNISSVIGLRSSNIENWEGLLIKAEKGETDLSVWGQELGKTLIAKEKAAIVEDFDRMAPSLNELAADKKANLINMIAGNPEKFAGIDNIRYATAAEDAVIAEGTGTKLFDSTVYKPGQLPLTKTTTKGDVKSQTMIYSQEFESFMLPKDFKYYGTAKDLGLEEKTLTKGLPNNWLRVPNTDWSLAKDAMGTAAVDAQYLKTLKYVDEMSPDDFRKIVLDPEDIPTMQAVWARIQKDASLADETFLLTKSEPQWDVVLNRTLAKAGVKPTYQKDMEAFTVGARYEDNFSLFTPGRGRKDSIDGEVHRLLSDWVGGRKSAIKQGVDAFFRGSTYNSTDIGKRVSGLVGKIYNHENSRALREQFRNIATKDDEGKDVVYLYRGLKGKAFGHNSVDSYTTLPTKAAEFTEVGTNGKRLPPTLYKVHVDDILGGIQDIGGKDLQGRLANEILVMSPTREAYSHISQVTTVDNASIVKAATLETSNKADVTQLFNRIISTKEQEIRSYVQQGVPMQTIALQTNTPLSTVTNFLAQGMQDLLAAGQGSVMRYSQAADMAHYLNADKRALVVGTAMEKAPFSQLKASIHKRFADTADSEIKAVALLGSKSTMSQVIGKYLDGDTIKPAVDYLRKEIDRIVGARVGSRNFQSADMALRDLGDVGTIVTQVGKDVQRIINDSFKKIWDPMKDSFTSISKDPVALTELGTAFKVNASLKGYREFREGKFYVQNAEKPWIMQGKTKVRNMEEVMYQGKPFEVVSANVNAALTEMQRAGREFYDMRNTLNELTGTRHINDIGFWMPPFNPTGKKIAQVFDKVENKNYMLYGTNEKELEVAIAAFKNQVGEQNIGRRYDVVKQGLEKDWYNTAKGRHDPMFMTSADSGMLHSGASAPWFPDTSPNLLSELVQGYENYVGYGVRSTLATYFSDVTSRFDDLSVMARLSYERQPLNRIQKAISQPKDPGAILTHTLLGNSTLDQNVVWQKASDLTNIGIESGLRAIHQLVEPVVNKTAGFFGKGSVGSAKKYDQLIKDLEARGVPNPFQNLDDHIAQTLYHTQQLRDVPNMTPRMLALSNSLAATMLLKVGEVGQAYVNAISLPILTSGAMKRKMAASFMGKELDPTAQFGLAKTMHDGFRYANHPEGLALVREAEKIGLFKPIISEATEVLSQARNLKPGFTTSVEKALESNVVNILSKPSEWSEAFVRKQAFLTGAYMAKEAYPGIGKAGQMTYARQFMDEVIGNYSAAQRPTVFQGTLGTAMGLFQTYMLTMAQSIYKSVERKDWKALSNMMLTQASIFGARSLPGFDLVSKYIGDNFSDQNWDLTTGTYRALPDKVADYVIYGLPSNLGPGISTRGEIQPRVPNIITGGMDQIAAVNILGQTYAAGAKVAQAAAGVDQNTGKAVLEALSLQSISRPTARIAEYFSGDAITQRGNLIASGATQDWNSTRAILSRLAATRDLDEIKMREMVHLNTFYGQLDKEARTEITGKLKTMLRDGRISQEKVEALGEEYFRNNGTPTGWRSAVNNALGQVAQPKSNIARNFFKPGSPFMMAVDDMD